MKLLVINWKFILHFSQLLLEEPLGKTWKFLKKTQKGLFKLFKVQDTSSEHNLRKKLDKFLKIFCWEFRKGFQNGILKETINFWEKYGEFLRKKIGTKSRATFGEILKNTIEETFRKKIMEVQDKSTQMFFCRIFSKIQTFITKNHSPYKDARLFASRTASRSHCIRRVVDLVVILFTTVSVLKSC